ncbi:sensor domain-containing diguanylate cyclase [Oxalicibacterium flavum]|uniref:diguanylate cyclase n=1 Tax=Oxalicibacterium flavum TaxID=179467 RepID=A0A8J2UME6_9BURK|nr:sensor domain-containing diguanylate cyclase [Oxalicibacterium flavum]GGC06760.1 sensor domain-containing diguanylate cyclase [Oxalicibacterium flavum]
MPDDIHSFIDKKRTLLGATATFVYLVAVSLIILVVWSVWQTRVQTIAESKSTTTNMARALAQHAQDAIRSADNLLVGMAELVEEQRHLHDAGAQNLHAYLRARIENQAMLAGLSVYDAQGTLVATSRPAPVRHVTITDRPYFQYHREVAERGPHVGAPIQSRVTNEWVVPVTRRLTDAQGRFAGLVLASVHVAYFGDYYAEFDIGQAGTIFLTTDDGTLLVRRAQEEVGVGTDISHGPVFNEYRHRGPVGTAMLTSRLDNTERLYSYRHLDTYPLLVAVALSKEDILSTWTAQTYHLTSITAFLLLLLGIIGFRLIFQINARDAAEYELLLAKEQLEKLNADLENLASIDGLTGLPNRRKFDAALALEFSRAARNASSIALIMIDVDRFKQFNDLYGHPEGDACLRQIGRVLLEQGAGRAADLPARYGGEEMVVLLPDTDLAGALAVAEKIRLAIRGLGIPHSAVPSGVVTVSAGVAACIPTGTHTAAQLLKAADEALYAAKAAGRDRVCCSAAETLSS